MLLLDDRNLPMPLQKTQISTISFGHSVGTGRTGVRPAPDVPRGCPPQSFLRQEGPANPSAANLSVRYALGIDKRYIRPHLVPDGLENSLDRNLELTVGRQEGGQRDETARVHIAAWRCGRVAARA